MSTMVTSSREDERSDGDFCVWHRTAIRTLMTIIQVRQLHYWSPSSARVQVKRIMLYLTFDVPRNLHIINRCHSSAHASAQSRSAGLKSVAVTPSTLRESISHGNVSTERHWCTGGFGIGMMRPTPVGVVERHPESLVEIIASCNIVNFCKLRSKGVLEWHLN